MNHPPASPDSNQNRLSPQVESVVTPDGSGDLRMSRRAEELERLAGLDQAYSHMIRIALPAGEITADQYIDFDRMAGGDSGTLLRMGIWRLIYSDKARFLPPEKWSW